MAVVPHARKDKMQEKTKEYFAKQIIFRKVQRIHWADLEFRFTFAEYLF
jgi:hypothetical protein